ncbi:MAG: AI-2E family transporter [Clostridia bacterium]|nr:AI-2E family transporter [Clostridia bacterium]
MDRKEKIRKWLWYFSFPAAAILLFKLYDNFGNALQLIGRFFQILAPFVGGFVLAFLLYGPCRWIESHLAGRKNEKWQKWARPVSIFLTYLSFMSLLALLFYLIIPILVDSLSDLAVSLPKHIAEAQENIHKWVSPGSPLHNLGLNGVADGISAALGGLLSSKNGISADDVLTALKGMGSVASSLINVLIAFVVSIYMLAGREQLGRTVYNFAGLFIRRRSLAFLRHYLRRTGRIFSKYIYGALLDALLVGVVASIGLLIFRIPYAVLFGLLLGMMNLIPYFGGLIGGVVIVFVSLLTNGLYTALFVAAFIIVIQQVDANIVQPRVIAGSMGLRPIYVLLGITFFGGLFGFWGILLGPPLMGVIQMIVRDIYSRRKKEATLKKEEAKAEFEEQSE